MTPEQKRAASAKEIDKALPANPADKGPVVLSSAAAKRAITRLEPPGRADTLKSIEMARKM